MISTGGDPNGKINYSGKTWTFTTDGKAKVVFTSGQSTFENTISASGDANVGKNLNVAQTANIVGATTITGSLTAKGALNLNDNLTVSGTINTTSNLKVIGKMSASTFLELGANAISGNSDIGFNKAILLGNNTLSGSAAIQTNQAFKSVSFLSASYIELSANAISGNADIGIANDIRAAGGYLMPLVFSISNVKQNTFSHMTSSYLSSAGDAVANAFVQIPMVRAGSVLGFVLNTRRGEVIKSGAFSASVTVNFANVACNAAVHTGSIVSSSQITKDTVAFSAGQYIGVSLTASADYLSEPNITSASFIGTVLVEC
jgi:hypothetical protein